MPAVRFCLAEARLLAGNSFSPKMPPMANGKQRLELTRIGKVTPPKFGLRA
jgi:hypothetical protein